MHKWIGKRYLHCLEILLDPENPCTLPRTRFPLFPSRPCYLDKTLLLGQNPIREGVLKKTVFFMVFCQTPPRMVFLRIKKFTPIFFWKLNLWLPKRILHLVPLKNLSFLSSYNGLLFPLIDYSKGRGDHQGSHKVPLSKLFK